MSADLVAWKPSGTSSDTTVSAEVLNLIAESVPDNTRKAYASDWRQFARWCAEVRRSPLPCTPETLVEYGYSLMRKQRAPATIQRAISAIRVVHSLSGQQPPDTLPFQRAMKGYRNRRADAGIPNERQADVLSIEQLRKISEALDTGHPRDFRDRVLLVLGWAMMARRGELVQLNIADAKEVGNGLEVTVRKAKADQAAVGRKVPVPYGSDPHTCPVRLLRAWLALLNSRGITDGALFRRVDSKGRIAGDPSEPKLTGRGRADGRLSGAGVWHIVKQAAARAGLDVDAIQAHSLRAGGATGAYIGGADLLSISRHGGWKDGSTVVSRYIRGVDAWQKNPMHGAGL